MTNCVFRHFRAASLALIAGLLVAAFAYAEPGTKRAGDVRYEPPASEAGVPVQFRLDAHSFRFDEETRSEKHDKIYTSRVLFPSPVKTEHEVNNTVHCQYYVPCDGATSRPAVLVLHILYEPQFALSRLISRTLARQGLAALQLQMPFYGDRRPRDEATMRLASQDLELLLARIGQAVLDSRRAILWLGQQPDVDDERLGLSGTSLGSFVGALVVGTEPAVDRCALILGGGRVADVVWSAREMASVKRRCEAMGLTYEDVSEHLEVIEPLRFAHRIRSAAVLMINARHDEVVPPAASESLWRALGQPEIVWVDAGHYTAALYLPYLLTKVPEHFWKGWRR